MSSKLRSIKRTGERAVGKEAEGMVEVTYGDLINATNSGAIPALLNQRFPGRLMQLVKFGRAVQAEIDAFEEAKKRLVEQHEGKLNETTGQYDFGANKDAADKEFQELLKTSVSITVPRLTEDELDQTSLVPAQVMMLVWLME